MSRMTTQTTQKNYSNGTNTEIEESVSVKTDCNTYVYFASTSTMFQVSSRFLIGYGVVTVLFDVLDFLKYLNAAKTKRWKNFPKGITRKPILNYKFYR